MAAFCTGAWGLCEFAACRRIAAACAHGCVGTADNSCTPLAPALVVSGDGHEKVPAEGGALDSAPDAAALLAAPAAPANPRYALHAMLGSAEQEDLEYLKALLGHVVPDGDLTQVLGRVFQAAIRELERRKFAVTARPRTRATGEGSNPRHVPRAVRRAVSGRDFMERKREEARARAVATCEPFAGAPLEARVGHALRSLAPPSARTAAPA